MGNTNAYCSCFKILIFLTVKLSNENSLPIFTIFTQASGKGQDYKQTT